MAKVKTRRWDPAEHLRTDEDIVAYIEAAWEDGDPELIALVVQNIARARGLTQVRVESLQAAETMELGLSATGDVQSKAMAEALCTLRTSPPATTLAKLGEGLPRVPQPPQGWRRRSSISHLRYHPA